METSDAIGVRATATYGYAEPGWLTDETVVDGAGTRTTVYGHDVAGNRTSEAVTVGGVTTTRSLAYAYGNRLTAVDGVAVAWNAFGETTTDHRGADIDRAADGAEVALSSVTGTALYAFTRGPAGEAVEVEEAVSGEVRSFLWGAGEADVPVSVLDGAGDDQTTIAVEGLVVGRLDAGAFVGMAPDGRGGVLLDGSTFLEGARAFGEGAEGAAGSSERRVWAMLERLPGTAYSLPRRRLYDAEVGRFASADPIGLAGGDHRFVYVGGNPNGGVDPSGLVWQPPVEAGQIPGVGPLPTFGEQLMAGAGPLRTTPDRWVSDPDAPGADFDGPEEDAPKEAPTDEVEPKRPPEEEEPTPRRAGAGIEGILDDAAREEACRMQGQCEGTAPDGIDATPGVGGGDEAVRGLPSRPRWARTITDHMRESVAGAGKAAYDEFQRRCAAQPTRCERLEQGLEGVAFATAHVALSSVGLVPGLGEAADVFDAGVSWKEGDHAGATLSAAAAEPIEGMAAGGVKIARSLRRGAHAAESAVDAVKAGDNVRDAEKVAEALDVEKAREVVAGTAGQAGRAAKLSPSQSPVWKAL